MKLRHLIVKPDLPDELQVLRTIGMNLWYTWNPDVQRLFQALDPELWEECDHNPIMLLATFSRTDRGNPRRRVAHGAEYRKPRTLSKITSAIQESILSIWKDPLITASPISAWNLGWANVCPSIRVDLESFRETT